MTPIAGAPAAAAPEVVVAHMDEQRGEALRLNAPPHVIVEIDAPLGYSDMAVTEPMSWQHAVQVMPFSLVRAAKIRFRILGEGERPLANAVVNLYGPGFPVQAHHGFIGNRQACRPTPSMARASMPSTCGPAADHWERYIQNPSLEPGQVNVIRLNPLDRTSGSFPGRAGRALLQLGVSAT